MSSDGVAAADNTLDSIDLEASNAARASSGRISAQSIIGGASDKTSSLRYTIIPSIDPSPLLPIIKGGRGGKSTVKQIHRVGYSLYKTPPEQAARCISLALRCGVRHVDVATLYRSNSEVCKPLKLYLDNGLIGLKKGYYDNEKEELLDSLNATANASDVRANQSKSFAPVLNGSAGRRGRREQLFISHKLSNDEQSTDVVAVKRSVKNAIAELGVETWI